MNQASTVLKNSNEYFQIRHISEYENVTARSIYERVESLYFCFKIQLKKKDNMCVRCLATIPRVNPFSEWLCACSVSKCANVNRNDCENIFGKK